MFTEQELNNIHLLVKLGVKSLEPSGDAMMAVGALLKKIEGLIKPITNENEEGTNKKG